MKTVLVIPGSGGSFYCQNCMRDMGLLRALRALGQDVVVAPMYLPLFTDETELGDAPVFYGAISLYLEEKFPRLRQMPKWCRRLMNVRPLLAMAAKRAGSTDAHGLEGMTLSVLRGEHGRQAEELAELVAWLKRDGGADVVHLSNALLLGLAGPIKRELGCRVVCSLQDEHVWLDGMDEEYRRETWQVMAELAADVDRFLPVSRYYGEYMAGRLGLAEDRFEVVYPGVDVSGCELKSNPGWPPVIGFLSRLHPALGLDTLVTAFVLLHRRGRMSSAPRLRLTGGATEQDEVHLAAIRRLLKKEGLEEYLDVVPEFCRAERIRFLQSLSVLSVPVPGGEAFGTFILEALACGVPVVQPAEGAFPEVVATTRGGVCFEPNQPEVLAERLEVFLADPARSCAIGRRGRATVHEQFSLEAMARRTLAAYER